MGKHAIASERTRVLQAKEYQLLLQNDFHMFLHRSFRGVWEEGLHYALVGRCPIVPEGNTIQAGPRKAGRRAWQRKTGYRQNPSVYAYAIPGRPIRTRCSETSSQR